MKTTLLIGLILAILRVYFGVTSPPELVVDIYKAAAHIFIGGLAVAWWFKRYHWQWRLFWALNVIEVAAALTLR